MALILLPHLSFVGMPACHLGTVGKVLLVSCSNFKECAILCQSFGYNDCLHILLLRRDTRVAMEKSLRSCVREV